ncbi:MAG TPA: hypothetical protein VIH89_17780 [Candidatus Sulfotelmatobacter sp.]
MGRWAEVYFTSPPEKRDEAVLELLRELQGEVEPPQRVTSSPEPGVQPRPVGLPRERTPHQEAESAWIVCESCGGRNGLGNRFCGMCAAPLAQVGSASSEPSTPTRGMWGAPVVRDAVGSDRQENDQIASSRFESDLHESHQRESGPRENDPPENDLREIDRYAGGQHDREFATSDERVPSGQYMAAATEPQTWPQSTWPTRPDVPSLIPEYEEAPNRRRLLVGAALGILILGLVYVAWKGSSTWSGTSHTLPQATPPVAETQPAAPDQTPPPAAQAETNAAPASNTAPAVERKPITAASRPYRKSATERTEPSPALPAASSSDTPGPIVASLQGNGSEELTVAESYLNGTRGRTRDTAEAAKWLWRSFGKKNAAAALLLSDLYIRGDGVPKSCDQARLLLDAAARKGASGAAERIQSLPSLGCQ